MTKTLPVTLLTLLLATMVSAQCLPGTSVEVAPMMTVVSVEYPAGMMMDQPMIEHKMTQYYENNRMVTMWVRPYPPHGMSEITVMLLSGFGNLDKNASADVEIVGTGYDQRVKLKRVAPGVYCGMGEFQPGWTAARTWITTPTASYYKTFNFWAGDMSAKPRMVNWTCPQHRMTTVSASCPICVPQP